MTPELAQVVLACSLLGGAAVTQKLATLKMALRVEAESQKAVAFDAGLHPSRLTRKLNGEERLTLDDLDRFPEDVQRAWHLEELARMGLPARAKRWLSVARELEARGKQSA